MHQPPRLRGDERLLRAEDHKTQANPAANPVARNGIVSYDLKVENWGTDAVSGVVVTDRLPAGFRFIDATDSAACPIRTRSPAPGPTRRVS